MIKLGKNIKISKSRQVHITSRISQEESSLRLSASYLRSSASKKGQSALALILLVGGGLVVIAVTLAFLANSFLNSAYGYRIAQRAQGAALSGAQDALVQLVRNKDFSNAGYSLTVGSDTATVTVTQDSPVANQVAITSTATVLSRIKTIRIVVAKNTTSSQITVISWTQ